MAKKTALSRAILFIALSIAVISGIWTFILKDPLSQLKNDLLASKNQYTPVQDKLLDWALDGQLDSLQTAAILIKKEQPLLSKKIKKYIAKQQKLLKQGELISTPLTIDSSQSATNSSGIDLSMDNSVDTKNTISDQIIENHPEKSHTSSPTTTTNYLRFKIGNSNIYYMGDIVNNTAQGQGKGVYDNGIVYEGIWEDNLPAGSGTMKWPDGKTYHGDFKDGKRSGQGTFIYQNKEKYTGSWVNNMRNGLGTLYDKKGKIKHRGEWKSDVFIY